MSKHSSTPTTLDAIREQIDNLDEQIRLLIRQRAEAALQVAVIKRQTEKAKQPDFYRPEREAHILRRILASDCSPLSSQEMARIFRTIMASCLALQHPLTVAYLGPAGTFSQLAAENHFGLSAELLPQKSIAEVFTAVQMQQAQYGIVPIENRLGGLVHSTLDAFLTTNVYICGEMNLSIEQNLLAKTTPSTPSHIMKIYAHPQSFLQCQKWLQIHYPHAEFIELSSNASACQKVSSEPNNESAAIAPAPCAELYNLERIATNIADSPHNSTRFVVIGYNYPKASGQDRTSLLIETLNHSGSLEKIIIPFSRNQINLCMIRSHQDVNKPNHILFFIDIEAHVEDAAVKHILTELTPLLISLRVLGSYPQANE